MCKHSLMLLNFDLVQSSSTEILSSGLVFHIHLTILASFLSSLITSSSLTGQVSFSYSKTACTHAEYLPFLLLKTKLLLANKGTKYLNSHHLLLILVTTLSNTPPSSYCVTKMRKLFPNLKRLAI